MGAEERPESVGIDLVMTNSATDGLEDGHVADDRCLKGGLAGKQVLVSKYSKTLWFKFS